MLFEWIIEYSIWKILTYIKCCKYNNKILYVKTLF